MINEGSEAKYPLPECLSENLYQKLALDFMNANNF